MKRRILTLAAAAVAMLTLSCAGARAGFVGLDNICSELLSTDAAPKLDDAFIRSLRSVWASSDGKTGVIFLRTDSSTYVLKIEATPDVGTTVSRRLMTSLRVPNDMVLVEANAHKEIDAFYTKLKNALASRPALVPNGKQQTLNSRIAQLDQSARRKLTITKFLTGYRDAPNLGVALLPPRSAEDIDVSTQAGRVAALTRFSGAMEALGSPHNQKLLGYLYMMDVLFGNEDRFFKDAPNLANIYIAAAGLVLGPPGTPCLAAIDNEARAPSQSYMAMNRYLTRSAEPPQLAANPAQAKTMTAGKQTITAREYLDLLMGFNKDQSKVDKPTFGPLSTLTGGFYIKQALQPAEQMLDQNKCDDVSGAALTNGKARLPIAIRRRFRAKLVAMINDMGPELSAWAGTESGLVSNKRFGDKNWGPVAKARFDEVCSTAVAYLLGQRQFRQVINWTEFDKFFAQGVAEATKDIGNMADMKGKIGMAFSGLPKHKMVDVSASGLIARAQFISYFGKDTLPKDIINRMLTDNKGEAYAKGGSFGASTYIGIDGHWEPEE